MELGHFLPIQPLNIVSMTIEICLNKVKIIIFILGFWGNYSKFAVGKNKRCSDFKFALLDNNSTSNNYKLGECVQWGGGGVVGSEW